MKFRLIKKFFLVLVFVAFTMLQVKGQEFPWSLQYVTNMQTINPAYVGIWDRAELVLSTKTNWVGISGAPISQYVNYSTPISEQKSGIGASIQRLNIGQEKMLFFTGDYSYRLRLDVTHYLQMGFRGGIVNYDNNLKDYSPYPDYIPDPNTNVDVRLRNMTVFGIGAVYFSEELYVSLSAPQLITNTFKSNESGFSTTSNSRTIYLSGGYIFGRPGKIRFRPNLLLASTIGKPSYFDVASIVYLPAVFQFGFNFRSTGSLCFFGQYYLSDRIRLGYAFDYSVTSDIRRFQLGTHELQVGYEFNIYKRKNSGMNFF